MKDCIQEDVHNSTRGKPTSEQDPRLIHSLFHLAAALQCNARSTAQVLQILLRRLAETGLSGLVALLDQDAQSLEIGASFSPESRSKDSTHPPEGRRTCGSPTFGRVALAQAGPINEVITSQKAVFLPNADDLLAPLAAALPEVLPENQIKALSQVPAICVVLSNKDILRGALALIDTQLKLADIPTVEAFARHVCIALENADLFNTLQHAQDRYLSLLDASTDAIFLETLEGEILDCNTAACQIFGYTKDEFRQLNVIDLVPDEISSQLPDGIKEVLASGGIFFEVLNKRKDGSLFPVEVSARITQVGTEKLAVTYVRDISERKQAEDTLQNVKDALRHRAEELAALHTISLSTSTQQDLQSLLKIIVEQATHLLRGTGGGFYVCDEEQQEVRCAVSYNTLRDYTGVALKYGEGVAGRVAQTGQPLVVDDYRTWPGRASVYEKEQPFHALISAPVIWQGQVTGVIHVLDSNPERRFTQEELELLTLFAAQAAMILENARLLESERRRRQEAETLSQATTALTSTLNLDELLDTILTCLKEVVHYESATVFLLEGDKLLAKAARGLLRPDKVLGHFFPAEDALFTEIQRSGQALILEDAQADRR